ncbi:laccase-15 [Brachypodium distachyon]|uniref:laccase n=1 Tax=Brachypodium distachyon TaxID=15368 RepID=A0A0Q3HGJ1_BRADI|nr:laccase-15 [Brachypodium distachyon]KQJ87547.1 hypothetical protein BRADI_4g11827v3 [Brachypodium distachyon]|eukprot:XP_003577295.1 laccase-15 [Brachypodium distachyon]
MAAMALSIATLAVFFFLAMLSGGDAAVVEHTFVVSQVRMNQACKDTLVTVVNGQVPGPAIEVTEGDSVVVHVVNQSPHGLTIHWHGVKQRLNCWADGVGMVTQCPIQPGRNFTYRFNVVGQEGTLWWHAHVAFLRATVHGALIIRPRSREVGKLYPFPKPHKEIPIFIGEWWEMDLIEVDRKMTHGFLFQFPINSTINGKLGDLYNCPGTLVDNSVMEVEEGKTYLLRIVNAALLSEYYLKIASHRFTVVAADANYVKPYTTDIIAIAPGESVDALVVADAPPGKYYMVALANQQPPPDTQIPLLGSRRVVQYRVKSSKEGDPPGGSLVMAPKMPDQHDTITTFYFHGNITSAFPHPPVPVDVDEHMFISLGLGSVCRGGRVSSPSSPCRGFELNESILVATMNNISFELPTIVPLLEAHYHNNMSNAGMVHKLPDRPPIMYNFTDQAMIQYGSEEAALESTSKATTVRRFRFNTTVEIVFQSTTLLQSDSNPMHLHGHDIFVLAQGFGNYNAQRDTGKYNLVDPPVRNTVLVPAMGWAVIRFVTNNPGVWFLHCHYGFHMSMGMAVVFEVDDGPTLGATLPPPPTDLPRCEHHMSSVAYE